eukprot:4570394-Amphidinium_carterae.1
MAGDASPHNQFYLIKSPHFTNLYRLRPSFRNQHCVLCRQSFRRPVLVMLPKRSCSSNTVETGFTRGFQNTANN